MDKKVYPPGAGDVTLKLGDVSMVLKCSLDAGQTISRIGGGIRGAIGKVTDIDYDMIATVIRAGLGRKEAKRYPNLEQMIYENGVTDSQGEVLAKVVEYLTNLARGGRPAPSSDDADEEGREGVDPQS